MENMVIKSSFWKGKKVLITGHTGFKGGWLSIWLNKMQAEIYGFSLKPEKKSLYKELNLNKIFKKSIYGDIRNLKEVKKVLKNIKPEIIIHLAAQSLVGNSYSNPLNTINTNIIGTANLLDCSKQISTIKVFLNVTSDKCYENINEKTFFKEGDSLGGHDPYSASKACSEIITSSYRNSFYNGSNIALATARAGNVIGGGDWSKNRLVPDVIVSIKNKKKIILRNPKSTRPWQHVLEPISGYLILCQKLYNNSKKFSESWNFGPNYNDSISVLKLVKLLSANWGNKLIIETPRSEIFYEAKNLILDCSKSKSKLLWSPVWNIDNCLSKTVDWYKSFYNKEDMFKITIDQINTYNKNISSL